MSNQKELLTLHGQLLAGDVRASSKIVELTIAPLVAIVTHDMYGLYDVRDVEEACFDALFKYLTAPLNYNAHRAELITYLAAIAKGKAMTLHRSQNRRRKREDKYALQNDEREIVGDEDSVIDWIDWTKFGAVLVKDPGDAEIVSLIKSGNSLPEKVAKALGLAQDDAGLAEAEKRIERIRGRARRIAERKEA